MLQEQLAKAEDLIKYIQSCVPTPEDIASTPENISIELSDPSKSDPQIIVEEPSKSDPQIIVEEPSKSDPQVVVEEPSKSDPQIIVEEASKTDPEIINDNSNPETTKKIMETIHITM
jgi:hypothetical protein